MESNATMGFAEIVAQSTYYTGQRSILCGAGACDPNDFNDRNSLLQGRMDTVCFEGTVSGIVAGSTITFGLQDQFAFQQNQGQNTVVPPIGLKPPSYVSSSSKDGSVTPNCAAFGILAVTVRPDVLYVNGDATEQHQTKSIPAYLSCTPTYHSMFTQNLASDISLSVIDEQGGCEKQLMDLAEWGDATGVRSSMLSNMSGSSVLNTAPSLATVYMMTTKSTGDNQFFRLRKDKIDVFEVNSAFLPTTTASVLFLWKIIIWGVALAASIACAPYTVRGSRLVSANG